MLTWYLTETMNLRLYMVMLSCAIPPKYVISIFRIRVTNYISLTMMSKMFFFIRSIILTQQTPSPFLSKIISWYPWVKILIENERTYHKSYLIVVISLQSIIQLLLNSISASHPSRVFPLLSPLLIPVIRVYSTSFELPITCSLTILFLRSRCTYYQAHNSS